MGDGSPLGEETSNINDFVEERLGYVYSEEGLYEPHEITFTVEVDKKVEIGDIVCIEHPSVSGVPVFYQVVEVPLRRRARDYEEDLIRLGKPIYDESRNYPRARAKQIGYYEDSRGLLSGCAEGEPLMLIEHIMPLMEVYRPRPEIISALIEPSALSIEIGSIYPGWKHTMKLELPKLLRQGLLVVGGIGTGKTTTMLTILKNIIKAIKGEGGNPHILIVDKDGEYGAQELISEADNSYVHIDIDKVYIDVITDKSSFYHKLISELGLHPNSKLARSLRSIIYGMKGPFSMELEFIRSLVNKVPVDMKTEFRSKIADYEKRLKEREETSGIGVSRIAELTSEKTIVHIDLSKTTDMEHAFHILAELFRRIYERALHDSSYGIIIAVDEAHLFAPEKGGIYLTEEQAVKDLKSVIELLATTGPRNGVTLLVATQRPSLISKTITTQMGQNIIAHRVEDVDLGRIAEIMGPVARRVRVLPRGWALVKALAAKLREPLIVRVNATAYPTSTGKTAYERFLERKEITKT